MHRAPLVCVALLSMIASHVAVADDHAMSPSDAIQARQGQMKTYQQGMKVLGDMARGRADYDATAAAASAAEMLKAASLDPKTLWLEGTDLNSGMRTRAKAEIWSDFDGFTAQSNAMKEAAEALEAAAATDLAALQSAMGPIGSACSACHRPYRGRR